MLCDARVEAGELLLRGWVVVVEEGVACARVLGDGKSSLHTLETCSISTPMLIPPIPRSIPAIRPLPSLPIRLARWGIRGGNGGCGIYIRWLIGEFFRLGNMDSFLIYYITEYLYARYRYTNTCFSMIINQINLHS